MKKTCVHQWHIVHDICKRCDSSLGRCQESHCQFPLIRQLQKDSRSACPNANLRLFFRTFAEGVDRGCDQTIVAANVTDKIASCRGQSSGYRWRWALAGTAKDFQVWVLERHPGNVFGAAIMDHNMLELSSPCRKGTGNRFVNVDSVVDSWRDY